MHELPNDEALLPHRLVLDDDVRLIQEHQMTDEGPRVAGNRLEMQGGLRQSAQLDANVLRFLVYCDGQRPLRDALSQLAEMLNLDQVRVQRTALPVVRHLMERGFLVRKGDR